MKIKLLPPDVANQIAAGEVIERPASVVKELIENAIDAKATYIQIEVDYGGVNRIKIIDDGLGIHPEDLPLAIQAHATSKISKLNDLYALNSMGFRGEALASIASISKLTILSKAISQSQAFKLNTIDASQVVPAARTQGTTIDVVDLFFNAPVRKKFLKSSRTEFLNIEAVVKRLAMSHQKLGIQLVHNGATVLALPIVQNEKSLLDRVGKLMGKPFLDAATQVDVARAGMRLSGWVADPEFHRSQNDKQWIFLNKRMVKDKLLNHALKQSFAEYLPEGRFPGCLLYLEVPASEVDVNVHPTKHEVRFQQPRLVHDFVTSELNKILRSHSTGETHYLKPDQSYPKMNLELREATDDFVSLANHPSEQVDFNIFPISGYFAIIGLAEGHFLIDVAKLYQFGMMERLHQLDYPLASRPLLVPVRCTLPGLVECFLEKHKDQLHEVGIDIDRISEDTMVIRSIPKALPQLDIKPLIQKLSEKSPQDRREFFKLLVSHLSLPALPLDEDAKKEAMNLFHSLQGSELIPSSWCKQLNDTFCSEILSD